MQINIHKMYFNKFNVRQMKDPVANNWVVILQQEKKG